MTNRGEVNRSLMRFARAFAREHPEWRGHERVVVTVSMRIEPTGVATHIRVLAPGPIPAFDAEAVARAAEFRFEPARIEGEPVAVLVNLPITLVFGGR